MREHNWFVLRLLITSINLIASTWKNFCFNVHRSPNKMLVESHRSLSLEIRSNFEHHDLVWSKQKIIRIESFNRTNGIQISNEIRRDFPNKISRSSNTSCYAMHRRYSSLVPLLFKWCNSNVSIIVWHNNVLIGECIQHSCHSKYLW